MRQPFLDVLRGIAVVLMIYTHTLNAWLDPAAKRGTVYEISAFIFALPSRLFLFLLGASLALKLHAEARRGASAWSMRRGAMYRGVELIALGLLLRLQDFRSHQSNFARLWKVDILNCMGAATVAMALLCLHRDGRPARGRALLFGLLAVAVAPYSVSWGYPSWLPAPIGAYFYGARPLAYFPLLPWVAFALLGLSLGDGWWRIVTAGSPSAEPAPAQGRAMRWAALCAALVYGLVLLLRNVGPTSTAAVVAREANPRLFLLTAAVVVLLTTAGYAACARFPGLARRGTPLMLLGQASLPIYFAHLMVCYGKLLGPIEGRLSLPMAMLGSALVTVAMLPIAWIWLAWKGWRRATSRQGRQGKGSA